MIKAVLIIVYLVGVSTLHEAFKKNDGTISSNELAVEWLWPFQFATRLPKLFEDVR